MQLFLLSLLLSTCAGFATYPNDLDDGAQRNFGNNRGAKSNGGGGRKPSLIQKAETLPPLPPLPPPPPSASPSPPPSPSAPPSAPPAPATCNDPDEGIVTIKGEYETLPAAYDLPKEVLDELCAELPSWKENTDDWVFLPYNVRDATSAAMSTGRLKKLDDACKDYANKEGGWGAPTCREGALLKTIANDICAEDGTDYNPKQIRAVCKKIVELDDGGVCKRLIIPGTITASRPFGEPYDPLKVYDEALDQCV